MNKEVSQVRTVALVLTNFVSTEVWRENDYLLTFIFMEIYDVRSFKVIIKHADISN